MNAKEFIEKEKEFGMLKNKKKLNLQDIYILLSKYATAYHEDKIKHLNIEDLDETYLNGYEAACNDIIKSLQRIRKEKKEIVAYYSSLSRARKYRIEAMNQVIYMISSIRIVVFALLKEHVVLKRRKHRLTVE